MWVPENGVHGYANGGFCPVCGTAVKEILYGFPTEEAMNSGEFVLGGCLIVTDQPSHACPKCSWRGFVPQINDYEHPDFPTEAQDVADEPGQEQVVVLVDPEISKAVAFFYFYSQGKANFLAYRMPEMVIWDLFDDEFHWDEWLEEKDFSGLERWVMDCDEEGALEIIELAQTWFRNPAIEAMTEDWVVDRGLLAQHGRLGTSTQGLVPQWFDIPAHFDQR